MKIIRHIAMLAILALTGCGMNPTQQKWAGITAGILITGAMVAHEADSGKPATDKHIPGNPCINAEACR